MAHELLHVVVGAGRGIGLEIAKALSARGDRVVAATRTPSPALRALALEAVEGVDVTSSDSVARFAKQIGERAIHRLVVVAGALQHVDLEHMDFERVREQFEVNAMGPLRVVHALLGNLRAGSGVFLITSRMGSIADNSSGGHYAYRMSKAALNMAGKSLACDLRALGIAVALLHPGFVRTDMTGGRGDLTAERSAALLIERMGEIGIANTGAFVHANGESLPW